MEITNTTAIILDSDPNINFSYANWQLYKCLHIRINCKSVSCRQFIIREQHGSTDSNLLNLELQNNTDCLYSDFTKVFDGANMYRLHF